MSDKVQQGEPRPSAIDNAHALIIGIANYQTIRGLSETVLQDARDVYELLTDPQRGGYRSEHVQLLLDSDASRSTITQGLDKLAEASDAQSTAVIYFSGHGARIQVEPAVGEYLVPFDADTTGAQAFQRTAISGEQFSEALRAISARKVLVVLDCCHAGGIAEPKAISGPALRAGVSDEFYARLHSGRGRVVLASSRDTEESWLHRDGARNSIFTKHLLAGLGGGIVAEDGLIRVFDVFNYVQPRVTLDQPNQHPVFKADKLEENFPVALFLGGQKGVVARDNDGFEYDVYISFHADDDHDYDWVWETLRPRLVSAGLRTAVDQDVERAGVGRITNMEEAAYKAKRMVLVLSDAYLADPKKSVENEMAQWLGVQRGQYRLIPVKIGPISPERMPLRLDFLAPLDFSRPRRQEQEWQRLIDALRAPIPSI